MFSSDGVDWVESESVRELSCRVSWVVVLCLVCLVCLSNVLCLLWSTCFVLFACFRLCCVCCKVSSALCVLAVSDCTVSLSWSALFLSWEMRRSLDWMRFVCRLIELYSSRVILAYF